MTLLHEILSPLGFNSSQIEDIFNSIESEGARQFCAGKWSVIKDRENLVIVQKDISEQDDMLLPKEGTVETAQGCLTITRHTSAGEIPRQRNIASLDADIIHFPLTLRKTRNGDRFAPFGMRGTKLVSDYLTDRKKSLIEKQTQLVVTDAKGEIVWIVDERPSSRCCISKNTKDIIRRKWNKR